ncbi:hypothetical protein PR048_010214 [Dryococelus australis]|uniref:RNA-directed DNA polymerase n=1 Tax=Dryococelus australis TaxID=614101 RepID=A0ABQ9I227_9NEOP|nr:hypothetical protein PR048_010214 [Dryococelus australis]
MKIIEQCCHLHTSERTLGTTLDNNSSTLTALGTAQLRHTWLEEVGETGVERTKEKSGKIQVSTLIHILGQETEDIMNSFNLSDEESASYEVVVKRFESHFIPNRNVIYERAIFNFYSQLADEFVDTFVTALHLLAEKCEYKSIRNELMHDRSTWRDVQPSEKAVEFAKRQVILGKFVGREKNPHTSEIQRPSKSGNEWFLASVNGKGISSPWRTELNVGGQDIQFKIDTEADITMVLEQGLKEPLLGWSAIESLGMLQQVEEVNQLCNKFDPWERYPKLFECLGLMAATYTIRLKNDAVPVPQELAFKKIKHLLCNPQVLLHYDLNKDIRVGTDASSYGIGAVLEQQNVEDVRIPVVCALHQRKNTHKLRRKHVLMWATDMGMAPVKGTDESDRLAVDEIEEYATQFMRQFPASDVQIEEVASSGTQITSTTGSTIVLGILAELWGLSVVEGILMKGVNMSIPARLQKDIMDCIHLGHLGIKKCMERARATGWWPGGGRNGSSRTRWDTLPGHNRLLLLVPRDIPITGHKNLNHHIRQHFLDNVYYQRGILLFLTYEAKSRQKEHFDRRHRTRERFPLQPNQRLWITDLQRFGKIISEVVVPRSYRVSSHRRIIRRNKYHLNSVQGEEEDKQQGYNWVGSYLLEGEKPTIRAMPPENIAAVLEEEEESGTAEVTVVGDGLLAEKGGRRGRRMEGMVEPASLHRRRGG